MKETEADHIARMVLAIVGEVTRRFHSMPANGHREPTGLSYPVDVAPWVEQPSHRRVL